MPEFPGLPPAVPTRAPRRVAPAYQAVDRHANGFSFRRQGAATKVLLDGQTMRWATAEWMSQEFLDRMAALRNLERKAPRGDSHAGWQKVAEVPLTWLLGKVPELDDDRRLARVLNDSDYRYLRCDGNHRRL